LNFVYVYGLGVTFCYYSIFFSICWNWILSFFCSSAFSFRFRVFFIVIITWLFAFNDTLILIKIPSSGLSISYYVGSLSFLMSKRYYNFSYSISLLLVPNYLKLFLNSQISDWQYLFLSHLYNPSFLQLKLTLPHELGPKLLVGKFGHSP